MQGMVAGPQHHSTGHASRADSDGVSTTSDSPFPDSPTGCSKSKIDLKVSPDGHPVFNARQRRTLRRALLRRYKLEFGGAATPSVDLGRELTAAERRIVVDVVQKHVGRQLPERTNVSELARMLISLGGGECDV